jgi:Tol biopolymer transport system component
MGHWGLAGLGLMASACSARLADAPGQGGTVDADLGTDAPAVAVDAGLGAWGAPRTVAGASSTTLVEDDGTLSSNTLELVFAVADAVNGGKDLYYTTRASPTSPWITPAQKLAFDLTGPSEETPRFSEDNLTLYFASDRAPATGLDIYRVTRTAIGSPWSTATLVAGPSTAAAEKWFTPCGGNRYLVIVGGDIAEGTLGMGAPTIVTSLSSPQSETGTFLTADCLTTYFASVRSGTNQLYRSARATADDAWPAPTLVTDFAGIGGNQEDPWISPDQRTFAFVSDVLLTKDLYISTR